MHTHTHTENVESPSCSKHSDKKSNCKSEIRESSLLCSPIISITSRLTQTPCTPAQLSGDVTATAWGCNPEAAQGCKPLKKEFHGHTSLSSLPLRSPGSLPRVKNCLLSFLTCLCNASFSDTPKPLCKQVPQESKLLICHSPPKKALSNMPELRTVLCHMVKVCRLREVLGLGGFLKDTL